MARALMRSLGYGPDNRLKVKLSAHNIPWYRDPAAILAGRGVNSFSMAISRRRGLSAGLITPRFRSKWPFKYLRRQLEMTERSPNL